MQHFQAKPSDTHCLVQREWGGAACGIPALARGLPGAEYDLRRIQPGPGAQLHDAGAPQPGCVRPRLPERPGLRRHPAGALPGGAGFCAGAWTHADTPILRHPLEAHPWLELRGVELEGGAGICAQAWTHADIPVLRHPMETCTWLGLRDVILPAETQTCAGAWAHADESILRHRMEAHAFFWCESTQPFRSMEPCGYTNTAASHSRPFLVRCEHFIRGLEFIWWHLPMRMLQHCCYTETLIPWLNFGGNFVTDRGARGAMK